MAIFEALRNFEQQFKETRSTFEGYHFRPLSEGFNKILDVEEVEQIRSYFETHDLAPENLVLKSEILDLKEAEEIDAKENERILATYEEQKTENFTSGEQASEFVAEPVLEAPFEAVTVSTVPDVVEQKIAPTLDMNEDGQLALDTGAISDLVPDTTIDPRGEGTFESDSQLLQHIFDVAVEPLHDTVPSPINSLGTEAYNGLVGRDDGEQI